MKCALLLLLVVGAGCGDNDTCTLEGPMCKQLSYYGLFDDIATQQPAAGVTPYDLETPLFSDYTTKHRFLVLPPGTTATWSDRDALDLPVGTVLVKTFGYLADRRDPRSHETKIETRLLIHGSAGWHGAAYTYPDDGGGGGDATLAAAGATVPSTWIHDDGMPRTNAYIVPNENQCKNCHAEHDDVLTPLGPKARHLNLGAQLQGLVDHGQLAGAPPPAQWPKDPDALDPTTGSLDQRARAFLDINCGHCHNPTGAARTSGLYLDAFETDPAKFGTCKPPVATGRGSGGLAFDIVPGKPDESIVIYRISSTEPSIKMPELGRNLVYDEGVQLLRDWISVMPGSCT
ncbi:MAG: SO2930 family diheme c-type cytochrome [Kofleriaceae bacterium]